MKKIIAFGGSNSKNSINKQLAVFVAGMITTAETKVIDLNDFAAPLYGVDLESESGIAQEALDLISEFKSVDGFVISLAEHNGSYSAAFKNIFDWLSRIEGTIFQDKPVLLMATSPGGRGGQSVLEAAKIRFPRHGANIVASFSLPSFGDNFSAEGIKDEKLATQISQATRVFEAAI